MPALYLLRHGQASFGADDYDVLSPLGIRQAELAGIELARRGVRTPIVTSGSLRRQRDTAGIAAAALGVIPASIDPRFDEFDAHAAVNFHIGVPDGTKSMTSIEFQEHLDAAMAQWIEQDDERWRDFSHGALAALEDVAADLPSGSDAVIATSAGITAAIVGRLLGADAQGVVALNRVSVNAAITTIVSGSRGLSVVSVNDHAHMLTDRMLLTHR